MAAQLSGVDTNLIVALDALLRESSVTRAARRIGLTQSAMSHALARLRDHLGDPLLVRAGRGMVLTPRAQALAPRVRRAVEDMADIFGPPDAFEPAALARRFCLATTDHVLLLLLAPIDARLRADAPGVDLHVRAVSRDADGELRDGATDAAIGVFADAPPDIERRPLFRDRFVCVVRKRHPVARAGLTLERYAALPHVLVAPRGDPRGRLDEELARLGLARRVARIVPHFAIAPHVVERGDYALTISERLARALAARSEIAILELPVALEPYTLALIWHRRTNADPAQQWFRDVLATAAATLPALTEPPGDTPATRTRGPRSGKPRSGKSGKSTKP